MFNHHGNRMVLVLLFVVSHRAAIRFISTYGKLSGAVLSPFTSTIARGKKTGYIQPLHRKALRHLPTALIVVQVMYYTSVCRIGRGRGKGRGGIERLDIWQRVIDFHLVVLNTRLWKNIMEYCRQDILLTSKIMVGERNEWLCDLRETREAY